MIGGPLGFALREAGPEDAEVLALIGAASFLDGFAGFIPGAAMVAHCAKAHSAEAYRAYFAKGARAFVGEAVHADALRGAPLGYALMCPPELPQAAPGDVELKRLYVLSRAHGGGLAQALFGAVAAAARAGGHQRLLLGTHPDNARAVGFYRKQGFATIGERRFQVGERIFDDIVMALPLGATPGC